MKLISLNIKGGFQGKKFFDYIKREAKTTDVFCFQEVYNSKLGVKVLDGENLNIQTKLQNLLKSFNANFFSVTNKLGEYLKISGKVEFGYAVYVKKNSKVEDYFCQYIIGSLNSEIDFAEGKETNGVQCVKINKGQKSF
jgi:hypothetical protein